MLNLEDEQEICKTSINLLVEKISAWFNSKSPDPILWFPDATNTSPSKVENKVVDIILFGNFFRRVSECKEWPKHFRIWVLCQASKETLLHFFNFKDEEISIIPRYELWGINENAKPFLQNVNSDFDLVYSGRISAVKNIELAVLVAFNLQTLFNYPLTLHLIGPFDNLGLQQFGQAYADDYKSRVLELINSLNWIRPPVIHAPTAPNVWPLLPFVNPILINFSTFMMEDFGVSVAQAQEMGWPCILSDWGAHKDIVGKVIKVPSCFLNTRANDHVILHEMSVHVCDFLNLQLAKENTITREEETFSNPPVLSTTQTLKTSINYLQKNYGESVVQHFIEGKIHLLWSYPKGKALLADYQQLFSKQGNKTGIIFNTFGTFSKLAIANLMRERKSISFFNLKDVENKNVLIEIQSLDNLILADLSASALKSFTSLLSIFDFPPIQILTDDKSYTQVNQSLNALLRNHDQILALAPSTIEEALELKLKESEISTVLFVEFELNSHCNKSCSYCPNGAEEARPFKIMDLNTFKKTIFELMQMQYSKTISFHFYGEPLLRKDLEIFMALTRALLPASQINLYSNGTLMTLERFYSLIRSGVSRFTITKHENVGINYAFENTLKLISPELRSLISFKHHDELEKTNRGGILDIKGKDGAKHLPCFIPTELMVITATGNILPCFEDFYEKLKMGNINEKSLTTIWHGENYKMLRNSLLTKNNRSHFSPCDKCNNCDFLVTPKTSISTIEAIPYESDRTTEASLGAT
jgi:radical SAM protein with 4Fe4S-binding SPASM domain